MYNYLKRASSIMGKEAQLNNFMRFSLLSEQVYNHYANCDDCKELFGQVNGHCCNAIAANPPHIRHCSQGHNRQ
jgi:adenine-specific DNA methylase